MFLLLFREKVGKKLFTVYRATLAALTIRLAGGRALHLNRRFGLRPGESKVFLYPCSCFQERGFLFLGMLQVQSPCQGARPQAGGYLCGRVAAQPPLGQRSVKTGLQVRSALQAKAWTFIYNLNPPTAHRGWFPRGCAAGPLALSRFLRRGAVPACKNRSAAPASPRCFCRRQRSAQLPHTGALNRKLRPQSQSLLECQNKNSPCFRQEEP